jgi:hypothetical protein
LGKGREGKREGGGRERIERERREYTTEPFINSF